MRRYFHIRFVREGEQVQVRIDPGMYGDATGKFYDCCLHNADGVLIAELIRERLQERYTAALQRKLEIVYDEGYKDGRGKKRRKKGLTPDLDPEDIGW